MNTDDLFRQMEEDELTDKAELAKMTPREYAAMKGVTPQVIYYYIRTHRIETEQCVCGRTVIDVKQANDFLSEKEEAHRRRMGATFDTGQA